jgi:prefoldin subunit 5
MKKYTAYYVIGAVLVGTGIYLYASKKNKNNEVIVNLNPPMEVAEEVVDKTETTIFTALDKLKALIDSIKSKGATTPPIQA